MLSSSLYSEQRTGAVIYFKNHDSYGITLSDNSLIRFGSDVNSKWKSTFKNLINKTVKVKGTIYTQKNGKLVFTEVEIINQLPPNN